jgi:arginyl-tRNA synthetase
MVEFAHPNTHKAFHIGHLRNITTGESLVRLLEATGHTVTRANYQGDVGMHIAKCLWAMMHLPECNPDAVRGKEIHMRVEFLGKAYAAGSTRYETDESVKKETGEINKQIYAKDPAVYPLYQETRAWSLEYFEGIYKRVGTRYDRFYFESEFYEKGKAFVADGVKKGIFVESDGAIIFPGEKHGLHNRVFITKEGNATYEGKEIGLGRAQFDEYHPDLVMHVVGPEQAGYFQVLFAALARMFPDTEGKEYHKKYGWVKLKHGKMSSRTGQVVLGEWLLDEAKKSIYEILKQNKSEYTKEEQDDIAEKGAIAAVKYAFLRVGTDQEIAFDLKESVSFDGDSGPYLLYSYARCKSVLKKGGNSGSIASDTVMKSE